MALSTVRHVRLRDVCERLFCFCILQSVETAFLSLKQFLTSSIQIFCQSFLSTNAIEQLNLPFI